MKIVEAIMTQNPCYTAGKKITVKGLMLHSVGCNQPKASVFINAWNSQSYDRACVHGFIDGNDGTIYQTLPWNHRGWHAGGTANNTHIGVEMCEPACLHYTSGAAFTCSDMAAAKASVEKTYRAAVELYAMLCKEFKLNPLTDIVSHKEGCALGIASNHGDPEHLWTQLKMGYTMDTFRKAVKAEMEGGTPSVPAADTVVKGLQAASLKDMTEADIIQKVGPLFTADQKKSGILASVSLAQFILESGYGKSELAVNANNCFGMKTSLSGNSWSGSAWDGKSVYTKQTKEEYTAGTLTTITADFRKYPCVEDSIADHSAYLNGAMNGKKLRYDGVKGCTDYKKAVQLIKDGGYATSSTYVENLCGIIERWNLTQFDVAENTAENTTQKEWYRVRKSWEDAKSQIGAFHELKYAKSCADEHGCGVYDENGKQVYSGIAKAELPFTVSVSIDDLNIRKGPGTNFNRTGKHTGKGIFTIMEVQEGAGSACGWGRLKSGAGWVSLQYAVRMGG